MRRLLAVVAAAAMVAGSLAIRSRLDRDEEERTQVLRLVCASEFEAVCQAVDEDTGDDAQLEITSEPAGTTADRLAGADDPGLDGWLVTSPWPEIVDARRRTRALPALFGPVQPPLARSPLVLVVWKERAAVLRENCKEAAVSWRCLGDAAATEKWDAIGGRPEWGPVKPGLRSPLRDGIGLLVLGHAVSGYFGRVDLSTIDLEDDGFSRWFSALARAPSSPESPLAAMLSRGPGVHDAAGTVEAEAGPLLARSARRSELELLYPSPMATADVVMARVEADDRGARLAELVGADAGREALAEAGWRVPGEEPRQGVGSTPLPPTAGLPPSGLLDALRSRWRGAGGR